MSNFNVKKIMVNKIAECRMAKFADVGEVERIGEHGKKEIAIGMGPRRKGADAMRFALTLEDAKMLNACLKEAIENIEGGIEPETKLVPAGEQDILPSRYEGCGLLSEDGSNKPGKFFLKLTLGSQLLNIAFDMEDLYQIASGITETLKKMSGAKDKPNPTFTPSVN